jgi:8-oxo-dGTP diphosphatase
MSQMSPIFPDCFYRVTIKGLCVRDGKLLLSRESENLSGQKWELPGGGLDFGEDIVTAFRREIEEEMGLKVTKMSKAPVYTWTWKYENRRSIDWFYSCVLAYRVEFEDLNITPSEECEAIEFFSKEEMEQLGLGGQVTPLPDIFNPADFADPF